MKVRIGYGLGVTPTLDGGRFAELVDALEALRFDSLWLSGASPEPVPSPWSASRSPPLTSKLKLGTSVQVLPGRNVHLLAKAWASLDRLSGGRCLPAFGLGVADPREQAAFGVARGDRARRFDEALPKLRALWAGEEVDGAAIALPVQSPLDVWLGGIARRSSPRGAARRRLAAVVLHAGRRHGEGRPVVEGEATHGRTIDPEHWEALIPYLADPVPLPDLLVDAVRARRPEVERRRSCRRARRRASDRHGLPVAAGASKFVLMPVVEPDDWPGASRRGGRRHRRHRELTGRPSRRT